MQSIQTEKSAVIRMKEHMYHTISFMSFDHAIIKLPEKSTAPLKQNDEIPLQMFISSIPRTCQGQKINVLTQIPTTLYPREKSVKSPSSLTPRHIRVKNPFNPRHKAAITITYPPTIARLTE
jgi:hypothetical protein